MTQVYPGAIVLGISSLLEKFGEYTFFIVVISFGLIIIFVVDKKIPSIYRKKTKIWIGIITLILCLLYAVVLWNLDYYKSNFPNFVVKAAYNSNMGSNVITQCMYENNTIFKIAANAYDGISAIYDVDGNVLSSGGGLSGVYTNTPGFDYNKIINCDLLYATNENIFGYPETNKIN